MGSAQTTEDFSNSAAERGKSFWEAVGHWARFPSSLDMEMEIPASSCQISATTKILDYVCLPGTERSM